MKQKIPDYARRGFFVWVERSYLTPPRQCAAKLILQALRELFGSLKGLVLVRVKNASESLLGLRGTASQVDLS